jgi:hypothetical protein
MIPLLGLLGCAQATAAKPHILMVIIDGASLGDRQLSKGCPLTPVAGRFRMGRCWLAPC